MISFRELSLGQLKLKIRRTLVQISLIMMAPLFLQAQNGTIKIGLLIPDTAQKEIIHACELALEAADVFKLNPDIPIELVVRSTEGPWGMGSKASVNLIYEDSVVAMLCALDGRNAHLAEQVAAKTQLACLETRATDPTLTQAYVPWYLRCVPSDDQQAEVILAEIERLGGGKTAILCTGEYDTRMTAHSFTKALARSGSSGPLTFNISESYTSARDLADQVREKEPSYLILSLNLPLMDELVALLRNEIPELKIFGTHAYTSVLEIGEGNLHKYNGIYLVTGALPLSPEGKKFSAAFVSQYGYKPGLAATYAYDGIGLIISAIQSHGGDRERIREYLSKIHYDDGLTGQVSFDELGNRINAAHIVRIIDGKPLSIH